MWFWGERSNFSLILLYFLGHKSHLWRLVVLRNHQQMAAMHQKPVLGFSRLARQHKREAPLMMRAKRVSTDDTLYHPSDFIPPNTCSHFASDRMEEVGPQTIEPERGTPHLFFFFSPHQHEIGVAPTPLLCIWFGAGQRQFAEAALDSAELLWRGSI